MVAQILDGKIVAERLKQQTKHLIELLGHKITLAVCLVGEDPASAVYVNNKRKACEEIGIRGLVQTFSSDTPQRLVDDWIRWANDRKEVTGILVQLPLPNHFDRLRVLRSVSPSKDVDCFHPENQGLLMSGSPRFKPCTPSGIMQILEHYDIETKGKHVVIINRSIVVGQPLASLLSQEGNATVTMCHEHTKNIQDITKTADIIITAVGKPDFRLSADMVSYDQVVIDVGIYRENGKIRGDSVFEEVSQIVRAITPVPGGVGPVTIAMLLNNTAKAYTVR
jgi:methylenetetrahydrofolate dehydrogenase (NADP+)/methenyltetrahydrofolate cyclohydrolase